MQLTRKWSEMGFQDNKYGSSTSAFIHYYVVSCDNLAEEKNGDPPYYEFVWWDWMLLSCLSKDSYKAKHVLTTMQKSLGCSKSRSKRDNVMYYLKKQEPSQIYSLILNLKEL